MLYSRATAVGIVKTNFWPFNSVRFYFHDLNTMVLVWAIISISLCYRLHSECPIGFQEEREIVQSRICGVLLGQSPYLTMEKFTLLQNTYVPASVPCRPASLPPLQWIIQWWLLRFKYRMWRTRPQATIRDFIDFHVILHRWWIPEEVTVSVCLLL
jgi:hypothetical protein